MSVAVFLMVLGQTNNIVCTKAGRKVYLYLDMVTQLLPLAGTSGSVLQQLVSVKFTHTHTQMFTEARILKKKNQHKKPETLVVTLKKISKCKKYNNQHRHAVSPLPA